VHGLPPSRREVVAAGIDDPETVQLLAAYFAELRERFGAFDPPSRDQLRADALGGAILLAREDGLAVACGSLRLLDPGTAEVKRMYVVPSARGRGHGRAVLRALEDAARALGCRCVVLDTAAVLEEAARMYLREGYVETERYNDNPYAARWFSKPLVPPPPSTALVSLTEARPGSRPGRLDFLGAALASPLASVHRAGMNPTSMVDVETARATRGLRLVTVGGIPSPWSEAAKGIFRMKEVPFVLVRLDPGDKAVREWTRSRNAPVAMLDDEPPRTGWAEILELAERHAPSPSLVPASPADRVRMYGLAHEIMGEGGLLWSGRLLTIHAGIVSEGARGFPAPVAAYLAKRYGYGADRLPAARARIDEAWATLAAALGDRPYYFGDRPTALDVYSAAAVNLFDLPPQEACPMWPLLRAAFESMRGDMSPPPSTLLAHRERMYERHMERPMVL